MARSNNIQESPVVQQTQKNIVINTTKKPCSPKLLCVSLQEWGFTLIQNNNCVPKNFNGKKCTIIWHIDSLKISHVSKHVVEDIIKKLMTNTGQESPHTTCDGEVHEYLGMKIDYWQHGKVSFIMNNYINKLLEKLAVNMQYITTTSASNHLFNTNPEREKLRKEQGQLFHHLVEPTRQDIQTAVAFFCSRIKT